MSDYLELRLAQLGAALEGGETKAFPPPKKGGKKKPSPPWERDTPATDYGRPSAGNVHHAHDEQDAPDPPMPPRKNPKRRDPKTGTPATKAIMERGRRAKITTWGPPQQHVDIRRAEQGVGSGDGDPRVNREHGRRFTDTPPLRGTGRAGGNGYTRARSQDRPPAHKPGNVRSRSHSPVAGPTGQMGEGASGRSGSAMTPGTPGNLRHTRKGLYDYSPDEVETAMGVAAKALGGVLGQLRDSPGASE